MAREALTAQVLDRCQKVRRILDSMAPLLEPIASAMMSEAVVQILELEGICLMRRAADGAAPKTTISKTPAAAGVEGGRKVKRLPAQRREDPRKGELL